jgi:hypothetical protein
MNDNKLKTDRLVVQPIGGQPIEFKGRPAWTLNKLISAGMGGISAAELPAGIRLSHYILKLRQGGIPVATDREKHGGKFAGNHARYRLETNLAVIESEVAA